MMSIEYIQEMARAEALKASIEKRKPFFVEPFDIKAFKEGNIETLRKLPNLGTYLPDGFKRYSLESEHHKNPRGIYMGDNDGFGAYMVDATGYGSEREPALTIWEFINRLKPGFYAIVEAGAFQVKIGRYERG